MVKYFDKEGIKYDKNAMEVITKGEKLKGKPPMKLSFFTGLIGHFKYVFLAGLAGGAIGVYFLGPYGALIAVPAFLIGKFI